MTVEQRVKHVPGKKGAEVFAYFLSTCGWCRKTKALRDSLGVEYSYLYVDLLEGDEKRQAVNDLSAWNSSGSFPTIVINGRLTIVGHQEERLREALADGHR